MICSYFALERTLSMWRAMWKDDTWRCGQSNQCHNSRGRGSVAARFVFLNDRNAEMLTSLLDRPQEENH
jgi:hypothetical protein